MGTSEHEQMDRFITHAQMAEAFASLPPLVPCRRCAGTGEYPPTDGDVCSWCDGEGEVVEQYGGQPTEDDPTSGGSHTEQYGGSAS